MRKQRGPSLARAVGWGALVGGGVGFALGLLLAPEKGQNVRLRMSYRLNALTRQVGALAKQWAAQAEDLSARNEGEAVVARAEEDAAAINSRMDEIMGDTPTTSPSASR